MSVPNYKRAALERGETIISREPGNSMEPILKSRQPVRLAPCKWQDVKQGDIVYAKAHGNYYTHIAHAVHPEKGVLLGNNHGHMNGWTTQVFGKVTEILPIDYKG